MPSIGAWVAHAHVVEGDDGVAAFSSEVAALRFAVERGWKVTLVPFGKTLAEAIAAPKVSS